MTMQIHENVTIVLPSAVIQEMVKIKNELEISLNSLYQTAIEEYVEKINRQKLRQEAIEMIEEYKNNSERKELLC